MLKPIDPKAIDQNVFSLIGEKWMLITAGTAERCNTMTASWGGLGVIWGAPSATCYIRPQRYTKGRPRPVRQQERPGGGQGEGVRLHGEDGPVRRPLF